MLPIGTLIRNLNTKLGTGKIRAINDSLGFFKHDLCGHILGGALLTMEGEGLAIRFETILHPSFKGGEEEIIEVLAGDNHSSFGSPLSNAEIDTYTSMLLYYRGVYKMDGTMQLVDNILNSPKQKGKYDNHKPLNSKWIAD